MMLAHLKDVIFIHASAIGINKERKFKEIKAFR